MIQKLYKSHYSTRRGKRINSYFTWFRQLLTCDIYLISLVGFDTRSFHCEVLCTNRDLCTTVKKYLISTVLCLNAIGAKRWTQPSLPGITRKYGPLRPGYLDQRHPPDMNARPVVMQLSDLRWNQFHEL